MALARWASPATARAIGQVPVVDRRPPQTACPPCVWCSGSKTEKLAATVETLESCRLFAGVDHAAIVQISRECSPVRVESHRKLFEEGDKCQGLWVIARGRMRLHHTDADGRQLAMKFFKPGDAIQLSAAVDGGSHGLGGTALEDSMFLLVPRTTLQRTLETQPMFARHVVDALCLMLRRVNVGATTREFRDAASRVRCALIRFAYEYGVPSEHGVRINYRLTRQDIADYVGVTVETAIRVMSQMQHEGVLVSDDSKLIEIPDFAEFTRAAGCAFCQFNCAEVFSPAGTPAG